MLANDDVNKTFITNIGNKIPQISETNLINVDVFDIIPLF